MTCRPIDLAGSKPQARTFDLTAQQVDHPRDISIVQVVPSQLRLAFDTRLTREVEVHPRVTGNFASGDQIVRTDADPPRIAITARVITSKRSTLPQPIPSMPREPWAALSSPPTLTWPTLWCKSRRAHPIRVTVVVEKLGTPTTH